MALQAKFSHIRIDEGIWDDPTIFGLTPEAFRAFIFAIAWSKSQHGRVPDGTLTPHGINRIGAPASALQELVNRRLIVRLEDGSYEIPKYGQWQVTSAEEKAVSEQKAEIGRIGAAKRWNQNPAEFGEEKPLADGFNFEQAFQDSWAEWKKFPLQSGKSQREDYGRSAFRQIVNDEASYNLFSKALQNKLRRWRMDTRPVQEKQKFFGNFVNFCTTHWEDYLSDEDRDKLTSVQPAPATPSLEKQSSPLAPAQPSISTFVPND
jgi:hypothetical protein